MMSKKGFPLNNDTQFAPFYTIRTWLKKTHCCLCYYVLYFVHCVNWIFAWVFTHFHHHSSVIFSESEWFFWRTFANTEFIISMSVLLLLFVVHLQIYRGFS